MTEITKEQIAQHAKEAGLYMTSEERIAAVEIFAKAIQAQTRRETLEELADTAEKNGNSYLAWQLRNTK